MGAYAFYLGGAFGGLALVLAFEILAVRLRLARARRHAGAEVAR
jgi:heme exporter protein CcmD